MDYAIIPAYNPDQKLIEIVAKLLEFGIRNIIVVNDGSEEKTLAVFKKLEKQVTLLNHEVNKGKGAAIKTALSHISENEPDAYGIVLLDADGQHKPEDALRLLCELHQGCTDLVLGTRSFKGRIPLRSLLGNTITKYVFRLCSGKWISDTQTGLRAFTKDLIPELLQVKGERYEYEMNMLLTCVKNNRKIKQIPIPAIYQDGGNPTSHFRTIRDSAIIYGNLFAFSGASFISFLLDYILFFPLAGLSGLVLPKAAALISGNILARIFSAAFNYYLNSTFIFKCRDNRFKSAVSYSMLACGILVLNSLILYTLNCVLVLNKALSKLITELMLFGISFLVQKFIIFRHIGAKEAAAL